MDPELEQLLQKRGQPRPFLPTRKDVDKYRKIWSAGSKRFATSPAILQALGASVPRPWTEKDYQIPTRDGAEVAVRLYTPNAGPGDGLALVVMLHGGGYCLGDLDTEEVMCRLICANLKVAVLNVDYRLAPEYLFPIGLNDSYDAVKWAIDHQNPLNLDLSKGFVLGGSSGGATYALIISHVRRDLNLSPPVTGMFLSVPILDDETRDAQGKTTRFYGSEYKSMKENANSLILNQAMTDCFWGLYQPDRTSPLYSPLLYKDYTNLPPAYFQVCSLDPFRDGALFVDELLRDAGSPTRIDTYAGLPHAFWAAFPSLAATKTWIRDTVDGAAWLLDQSQNQNQRTREQPTSKI